MKDWLLASVCLVVVALAATKASHYMQSKTGRPSRSAGALSPLIVGLGAGISALIVDLVTELSLPWKMFVVGQPVLFALSSLNIFVGARSLHELRSKRRRSTGASVSWRVR